LTGQCLSEKTPSVSRGASRYDERVVGRRLLGIVAVGAAITSGVVGVAASPAAENRFKLSPELEARVTAHREMVANAGRSIADFCRLASDTVELLDPIRLELSHFEGDQRSSPPFAAVERAYTRTTKRVPGLYLYAFEEGYRTGIDYPTLARLAPDDARA